MEQNKREPRVWYLEPQANRLDEISYVVHDKPMEGQRLIKVIEVVAAE